mgnify:CR=1 FL=1
MLFEFLENGARVEPNGAPLEPNGVLADPIEAPGLQVERKRRQFVAAQAEPNGAPAE